MRDHIVHATPPACTPWPLQAPHHLSELCLLTSLHLSDAALERGADCLCCAKALRQLSLSACYLQRVPPELSALAGLTSLRWAPRPAWHGVGAPALAAPARLGARFASPRPPRRRVPVPRLA